MLLSKIIIYPIKSLGGVHVTSSWVEERGLKHDRRMMLVDENGCFLNQRSIPEMALFKCHLSGKNIQVSYQGDDIEIPLEAQMQERYRVEVWDDQVNAAAVHHQFDDWFSDHLHRTCRLVVMDNKSERKVDNNYRINNGKVSFADGFPILLANSASLSDLNTKLQVPVGIDRFRPNLVIETNDPFLEDTIDEFRIADVYLKAVKPCARCQVINIDQSTAEKSKEPLKMLSGYRQSDHKVFFGENIVVLQEGLVNQGDPIEIISFKERSISMY